MSDINLFYKYRYYLKVDNPIKYGIVCRYITKYISNYIKRDKQKN